MSTLRSSVGSPGGGSPGGSAPRDRVGFLGHGALAQLVERLLCKQEVRGSIPLGSTTGLVGKHAISELENSTKKVRPLVSMNQWPSWLRVAGR